MPGRRLTAQEISDVRARRAEGIGESVIAESFGISRATVARYTAGDGRIVQPRRSTSALLFARTPRTTAADGAGAQAWEPACMDAPELEEYRAGRIAGCRDCTTDYATQMRAAGRCNGVPGELLAGAVADEDDEEDKPVAIQPLPERTEQVPVRLETPCGGCAHQPICRIQPAASTLPVSAPRMDRALTVVLTATVECTYFLKAKRAGRPSTVTDDQVLEAVAAADGNVSQAAKALGLSSPASLRERHGRILARQAGAPA